MFIMSFIRRSPARASRWRTTSPLEASMGALPVQDANLFRSVKPAGHRGADDRRPRRPSLRTISDLTLGDVTSKSPGMYVKIED
jgi:hypothetical protein